MIKLFGLRWSGIVALARLYLNEASFRQDVGSKKTAHHASRVDADRPFQLVYFWPRRVAINHEGRTVPQVGPSWTAFGFGALTRFAVAVHPGTGGSGGGGFFSPGLLGKKPPVKNRVFHPPKVGGGVFFWKNPQFS